MAARPVGEYNAHHVYVMVRDAAPPDLLDCQTPHFVKTESLESRQLWDPKRLALDVDLLADHEGAANNRAKHLCPACLNFLLAHQRRVLQHYNLELRLHDQTLTAARPLQLLVP